MFPIATINRGKALTGLITLIFSSLIILLPRYDDLAKVAFVVLILTALVYLVANLNEFKVTSTAERTFLAAIIVNFLWIAFCFYINGEPGRGNSILWGRHFYLLFAVPLFFLFRRANVSDNAILITLFGSITFSLVDIIIDIGQGTNHTLQGMNPNAFGPIQLCLSGILFFYFLRKNENWLRWFALAGFVFGIATVIFSKSRNTWVTLAILSIFFIFYLTGSKPVWKRLGLSAGVIVLLISSYQLPIVESRINYAIQGLTNYFTIDDYRHKSRTSSLGVRFELWKTGWYIFRENPVLGVGVGGFKVEARKNSERYQVNERVHRFKYVHNQYIAALATRGMPGLVFFLLVMLLPIYIARTHKGLENDSEIAQLSIILICLNYLVGNLGEDHFEGKSATMFYGVMIPFWLARISTSSNRQGFGNPP